MTIAERDGATLRKARAEDLPAIDALTIEGYTPIQESYVAMLGEGIYEAVRHRPDLTWEERKCAQNRDLFDSHPEQVWVERDGDVFGYVTSWLFPARRAYEAVGFDRQVPVVEYWQDLSMRTPGSAVP